MSHLEIINQIKKNLEDLYMLKEVQKFNNFKKDILSILDKYRNENVLLRKNEDYKFIKNLLYSLKNILINSSFSNYKEEIELSFIHIENLLKDLFNIKRKEDH